MKKTRYKDPGRRTGVPTAVLADLGRFLQRSELAAKVYENEDSLSLLIRIRPNQPKIVQALDRILRRICPRQVSFAVVSDLRWYECRLKRLQYFVKPRSR